jgi:hypothetical protein
MKAVFNNNILDIVPDDGEELSVFRETVYKNRVIVFKKVSTNVLQEFHFDKSTGELVSRQKRKDTLPKFKYVFEEHNIQGEIEHKFLDEIDFKDYKPQGIDIETVFIKLTKDGKVICEGGHWDPINQTSDSYFERVERTVQSHIENEQFKSERLLFLKDTYSKWTLEEKARYQYNLILFHDRMQGGYPSAYKNPAATYFSKWFIDTYSPFDNNIISTLKKIAKMFEIDTKYLTEMIQFDITSSEWKEYARKLDLLSS